MRWLGLVFPGMLFALTSCKKDKAEPVIISVCDTLPASYGAQISAIILNSCAVAGCHVAGGSGLGDFTTYTGVKAKADNGSLKLRAADLKDMPPFPYDSLTALQVQQILCWISKGAPDS